MAEGYALAQEIANISKETDQGAIQHGNYSWIQQTEPGFPWGAVGNTSNELTLVNQLLLTGNAYDPETLLNHDLAIPMTTLQKLAETGPTHHLIGYATDSDPMGAFEWTPLKDMEVKPTQRSMWAADAATQKSISAEPTHGGNAVDQEEAKRMAKLRSKWFTSRNIRWTSQALAMAKTSRPYHGGRAWIALQKVSDDIACCMALYYNSIFGAIVWNSYGSSTQAGRAPIQVTATAGLPVADFSGDSEAAKEARTIAKEHFEKLSKKQLGIL